MNTVINITTHEHIYENTLQTAPQSSPMMQCGYKPYLMKQKSPYRPPESAWKNLEFQELHDELIQLRRKEEAHDKWRHEVEKKWKETEEENQNLRGEVKQLKEEYAQLWSSIHPVTHTKRSIGMQISNTPITPTTEPFSMDSFSRRDEGFLQRTHSYNAAEVQRMSDEVKSLNSVIQQLHEDKTDLIEKQNRAEKEIRSKKQLTKTQEAKLQDNIRKDEHKSFEIELLRNQILNYKNENANLNLIIKENFHRLK